MAETVPSALNRTAGVKRRAAPGRLRNFGRVLAYFLAERNRLLLAMGLLLPVALAGALQPLLVGQAVSVLRGEPTHAWLQGLGMVEAINILIVALAVTMVLSLVLQGYLSYMVQNVGQQLTARIRIDLFDHALALGMDYHVRTPVGQLLTRLTSDVEAVAEMFGSGAIGVLADLVSLLVIAVAMVTIDWRLGLLLALSLVPVSAAVVWMQMRFRQANYRVREGLGSLNAELQENLQGLEVVQMFRREARNSAFHAATGSRYRRSANTTIFFDAAISSGLEWVSIAAIALVIALGGWLVTRQTLTIGTLTTFVLYAQRLFIPLRQAAERFTVVQSGFTGLERIGELLAEPVTISDTGRRSLPPRSASSGEVVFEHVTFGYGLRDEAPVLKDLSFRVAAGETVALVGPTGSGKSTIINLLCRLWEPHAGRILLDGTDIRDISQQDLRRRLGVVLQDTFLFSGDIATNLSLGEDVSRDDLQETCWSLGLNSVMRKLPQGLSTALRERGANLSVGERQLLAVARVAIRNPDVLVMDEATAHLDPSTEATLQRNLAGLMQRKTAIVIAHRLSTIEASDRILVLNRGGLQEEGTHAELKTRGGLYGQLAALQDRLGESRTLRDAPAGRRSSLQ